MESFFEKIGESLRIPSERKRWNPFGTKEPIFQKTTIHIELAYPSSGFEPLGGWQGKSIFLGEFEFPTQTSRT